jgi:hypothetical protein
LNNLAIRFCRKTGRRQFGVNSGHDTSEVTFVVDFKGKGKFSKAKGGHKESNKPNDSSNSKIDKES